MSKFPENVRCISPELALGRAGWSLVAASTTKRRTVILLSVETQGGAFADKSRPSEELKYLILRIKGRVVVQYL